ncbi:protein kinase [Niveibacterium sp. SC-1]|uniref:serine/threonine protein kinase n=1 Tax=Niveibacterium sp. SC-1 TaxID=3135646 RepID=UPI00311E4FAB
MSTQILLDPATTQSNAGRPLPLGHRMSELEITGVLGIGGFGIVYRAFDHALQRVVAIKEYMPGMLAVRDATLTVALRSERCAATFQAGRGGFINEARLLAQFDHPGLIKVLRYWEAHGTAYMLTPFYEGQTLKQRLAGGRALGEAEILRLVAALLGALETLHRAQCYHRDIALDNVLVQPDGRPVLLDFGAARKLIGDLADDATVMLKPGYAPIEQYTDDPAFRQGPWTDIYALGAVMHVMVCGELPHAAVVRSIQDNYVPLERRALGYSPRLLHAVDRALRLRIEDRPQSVAAFAALLGLHASAPAQYEVNPSQITPSTVTPAMVTPRPTPVPVKATPVTILVAPRSVPEREEDVAARTDEAVPRPFLIDSLVPALDATKDASPALQAEAAAIPDTGLPAQPDVSTADSKLLAPEADAGTAVGNTPAETSRRFPRWSLALALGIATLVGGGFAMGWLKPRTSDDVPTTPTKVAAPAPEPAARAIVVPQPPASGPGSVVATEPTPSPEASAPAAQESVPVAIAATEPPAAQSPASAAGSATAAAGELSELEHWTTALAADSAAAYREYLERFPQGSHAEEASTRLADASRREKLAATPVSVPVRIQPWGELFVAGRRRGVSPPLKSLNLLPGPYEIEVRNGSLPPYRTRIVVAPGKGGAQIAHRFE